MTTPADADKRALTTSQAGMRLIALLKIVNDANWVRLHTYMTESCHETLLSEQSAEARVQAWRDTFQSVGRQRIKQVLAAGKHQVSLVLSAEHSADYYYAEVAVEDDYPHRIVRLLHTPLEAADDAEDPET